MFICHYCQWPILINCVMCYYLCVLRWLMRPILALNCLLQIEQERSEEESSVGNALALAFRCARFCSASLILFASYSPAPLFMRPRHSSGIPLECQTIWIQAWSGSKLFAKVISRRQKLPLVGKDLSGLFLKITLSCEIEVSLMGKKLISYRQRWEKKIVTWFNNYSLHTVVGKVDKKCSAVSASISNLLCKVLVFSPVCVKQT